MLNIFFFKHNPIAHPDGMMQKSACALNGIVTMNAGMTVDELADNFMLFDDWEDRYRYLIDLGKKMPPLPEDAKCPANKVDGCMSQVWLTASVEGEGGPQAVLTFHADSDAHIVRGLLAILLILFSGKPAVEIVAMDADAALAKLDLDQHISPNRRNGVASVVRTIQRMAARLVNAGG